MRPRRRVYIVSASAVLGLSLAAEDACKADTTAHVVDVGLTDPAIDVGRAAHHTGLTRDATRRAAADQRRPWVPVSRRDVRPAWRASEGNPVSLSVQPGSLQVAGWEQAASAWHSS
jgi:hypothetical protein